MNPTPTHMPATTAMRDRLDSIYAEALAAPEPEPAPFWPEFWAGLPVMAAIVLVLVGLNWWVGA